MPHPKTRTGSKFFCCAATALACIAGTTWAMAPVTWDGEAGDLLWFSDDNWNPNGVPGEMDTVTIDSGGRVTAASMPIEVISVEALSGLELISSSLKVATDSMITDFLLGGCCTTPLDSGGGTITYLGNHVFERTPSFIGSHTIEGTAVFNDNLFIEELGSLTIDAQATINGGTAQQWPGASASITGTLNLNNASLGNFFSNPDATWFFDGGNLAYTGTADAVISDKVFVTGGTVSADTKQLEFVEEFVFQDAQVVVSNGGRIVFDAGMPELDGEVLEVNSFSGDGRIEIQGSSVDMGNASSTTSVSGDGFWVRDLLLIDGELSNTAAMQIRGGTVDGNGRLTIEGGGTLDINFGGEINTETIVRSGGLITLNSQLTLANELRIDSGGVVDLTLAGIRDVSGGTGVPSNVAVFGALRLPTGVTNSAALDDVPLNLRAGGSIIIEDRQLVLRGGGELQAGQVVMTDTPASGFPKMLFSGDANDTYGFSNGVEISNDGGRAEITIGNGVGEQPLIFVSGEAIFNITGDNSFVLLRVPLIEGASSGITNNGNMIIQRMPVFNGVGLFNAGNLELTGTTTMSLETLENSPSGQVLQRGNIILSLAGIIQNDGEWLIEGSRLIEPFTDQVFHAFRNNGTVRAISGGTQIKAIFDNNGQVIADGAQISFTQATTRDPNDDAVLQGRWQTINNGKILFPENPPTVLRGPGTVVEADADDMPALNQIEKMESCSLATLLSKAFGDLLLEASMVEVKENGTFGADGALTATNGSEISIGSGASLESNTSITAGSDDIMLPSVTDDITGVIQLSLGDVPPPSISAPIINIHANLTPIRNDVGVMNTAGTLTIHPTGTLRINARADSLSSSINHTGDLDILGNISITPIKSYEPQIGDTFTIATVSGTIGTLPSEAIDASGDGTAYAVGTSGSDIVVTVIAGCPADLTMDGEINFFDVSAFLTAFNSMNPVADFNNDGMFNFFDVSEFLSAYNAGCP